MASYLHDGILLYLNHLVGWDNYYRLRKGVPHGSPGLAKEGPARRYMDTSYNKRLVVRTLLVVGSRRRLGPRQRLTI